MNEIIIDLSPTLVSATIIKHFGCQGFDTCLESTQKVYRLDVHQQQNEFNMKLIDQSDMLTPSIPV